jgi:hypothetical protein
LSHAASSSIASTATSMADFRSERFLSDIAPPERTAMDLFGSLRG